MAYCEVCGSKLAEKELKNEGIIPFCPNCGQYRFEKYNVAVIMIVLNSNKDKALLIEQYGNKRNILVAGYVNKGESLEKAVEREIKEEIGVKTTDIKYLQNRYFAKSNALMVNFLAVIEQEELMPNEEVDAYHWYSLDEASKEIAAGSLAQEFYNSFYERFLNNEI